mmetsp:Transcript_83151/g.258234  ORF Transcript_83151/g.258234 Transcript_83151/m.258234 type:complete len:136 (-) Transcript_83151:177-584(-)
MAEPHQAAGYEEDAAEVVTSVTTLAVCGIPRHFELLDFVDVMACLGFADKYDFFSIVMRKRSRLSPTNSPVIKNLGYGFVNFNNPEDTVSFRICCAQRRFGDAIPAKMQGFFACVTMLELAIKKNKCCSQALLCF